MKKVMFNAIDPKTEGKLELEGRPAEFIINEYGDEYRVPCFVHKKGPFYYVFERISGLEVTMRGQRTIKEALEEAAENCLKNGGIKETERAIDRAVALRGEINT